MTVMRYLRQDFTNETQFLMRDIKYYYCINYTIKLQRKAFGEKTVFIFRYISPDHIRTLEYK